MNIGAHPVGRIDETIDLDMHFADPFSSALHRLSGASPSSTWASNRIEDQLEIAFGILRIFKSSHEQPVASARSLPRRGFYFRRRNHWPVQSLLDQFAERCGFDGLRFGLLA